MKRRLLTIRHHAEELMSRFLSTMRRRAAISLAIVAGAVCGAARPAVAAEGLALASVYDTAGSMKDSVPTGGGKYAPKYVVANKAWNRIIDQISHFATNAPS